MRDWDAGGDEHMRTLLCAHRDPPHIVLGGWDAEMAKASTEGDPDATAEEAKRCWQALREIRAGKTLHKSWKEFKESLGI